MWSGPQHGITRKMGLLMIEVSRDLLHTNGENRGSVVCKGPHRFCMSSRGAPT